MAHAGLGQLSEGPSKMKINELNTEFMTQSCYLLFQKLPKPSFSIDQLTVKRRGTNKIIAET